MKKLLWNKHTKLVLKHAIGWLCILLGIIMLITPGQGILTILIGIYLLADHVPAFGRLKAWLQKKFPRLTAYVHRKTEQLKQRYRKDDDRGPE